METIEIWRLMRLPNRQRREEVAEMCSRADFMPLLALSLPPIELVMRRLEKVAQAVRGVAHQAQCCNGVGKDGVLLRQSSAFASKKDLNKPPVRLGCPAIKSRAVPFLDIQERGLRESSHPRSQLSTSPCTRFRQIAFSRIPWLAVGDLDLAVV